MVSSDITQYIRHSLEKDTMSNNFINRLLIVQHSDQDIKDNKTIACHGLLGAYTWHNLDNAHVLVNAEVDRNTIHDVDSHPATLLLPHHSNNERTLTAHATYKKKPHLLTCLSAIGLKETDTVNTLYNTAIIKFGDRFVIE